jgi:hypothetical protein
MKQESDFKALCRIGLVLIFVLISAVISRAVVIEGFTPSGQFVSVQVSDNGELRVAGSTSIAQAVFFLSSQPVNAFQASYPWYVASGSVPVNVNVQGFGGGAFSVLASSCGVVANTPYSISTLQTKVLDTNVNRCSSLLCNWDASMNVWLGPLGVSASNGQMLGPGACLSPDNPIRYSGIMYAVSTGAVSTPLIATEITP